MSESLEMIQDEAAAPVDTGALPVEELAAAPLVGTQRQAALPPFALLGEILWLFAQSREHAATPAAVLLARVLPALAHRQARLIRQGNEPVAFVSWARLSDEAEERWLTGAAPLRPQDWASGGKLWLVD